MVLATCGSTLPQHPILDTLKWKLSGIPVTVAFDHSAVIQFRRRGHSESRYDVEKKNELPSISPAAVMWLYTWKFRQMD